VNIGNSQVGYNAAWLLAQADTKINILCRYEILRKAAGCLKLGAANEHIASA